MLHSPNEHPIRRIDVRRWIFFGAFVTLFLFRSGWLDRIILNSENSSWSDRMRPFTDLFLRKEMTNPVRRRTIVWRHRITDCRESHKANGSGARDSPDFIT